MTKTKIRQQIESDRESLETDFVDFNQKPSQSSISLLQQYPAKKNEGNSLDVPETRSLSLKERVHRIRMDSSISEGYDSMSFSDWSDWSDF